MTKGEAGNKGLHLQHTLTYFANKKLLRDVWSSTPLRRGNELAQTTGAVVCQGEHLECKCTWPPSKPTAALLGAAGRAYESHSDLPHQLPYCDREAWREPQCEETTQTIAVS